MTLEARQVGRVQCSGEPLEIDGVERRRDRELAVLPGAAVDQREESGDVLADAVPTASREELEARARLLRLDHGAQVETEKELAAADRERELAEHQTVARIGAPEPLTTNGPSSVPPSLAFSGPNCLRRPYWVTWLLVVIATGAIMRR